MARRASGHRRDSAHRRDASAYTYTSRQNIAQILQCENIYRSVILSVRAFYREFGEKRKWLYFRTRVEIFISCFLNFRMYIGIGEGFDFLINKASFILFVVTKTKTVISYIN